MKNCLIVDDSKVIRTVARKILEDLDFNVEESEDGQKALEACQISLPDAILLDWNMPIMNGIEFLYKLRELKNGQAPKVILCSVENDLDHIHEAMDAGANEYIMKPFDSDIIQSKLMQVGLL